jgi:hypothetical protein
MVVIPVVFCQLLFSVILDQRCGSESIVVAVGGVTVDPNFCHMLNNGYRDWSSTVS